MMGWEASRDRPRALDRGLGNHGAPLRWRLKE